MPPNAAAAETAGGPPLAEGTLPRDNSGDIECGDKLGETRGGVVMPDAAAATAGGPPLAEGTLPRDNSGDRECGDKRGETRGGVVTPAAAEKKVMIM